MKYYCDKNKFHCFSDNKINLNINGIRKRGERSVDRKERKSGEKAHTWHALQ
jgi:hypothetical protein